MRNTRKEHYQGMRKKQVVGALSRHEKETHGRSIIKAWESNKRKEHYQGMRKKQAEGALSSHENETSGRSSIKA